ncbi:hypothetical protein Leryth_020975 [Lithospermum erythrorhizon]|nr:hypothetical protein Leryth_020975 [Lithospermum erythrorhizon]
MAVQAQYPSNILLLNRNTQEGKNTTGTDYSLQQQTGGGGGVASSLFDHQPPMLFNPGVEHNNTRKRSRELLSTMNNGGPLMALQQPQISNQIINLSQLQTGQIHQTGQNHPNNVVSTGLRLAFGDQLQQQKQHPLHHQTQQQQLSLLSSQSSQNSSVFLPFLSDDLASHIKQQREEIDNFITFQGEQLRRALAEKRQRTFRTLLIAAEESASRRLREKEVEAEKAYRHNAELESQVAQLSATVQASQERSRNLEVTVAALQAELQQAMLRGGEKGELGCGGSGEGVAMASAEDAESGYVDPDRVVELDGAGCKGCGRRVASMVLLPCRHLCLCKECDSVAKCCPLCYTFRNSSVEIIMC